MQCSHKVSENDSGTALVLAAWNFQGPLLRVSGLGVPQTQGRPKRVGHSVL